MSERLFSAEFARRRIFRGAKGAVEGALAGKTATAGDEGQGEFGFQEQAPGFLELTLKDGRAGRAARDRLEVEAELPLGSISQFLGHVTGADAVTGVLVDIIDSHGDARWSDDDGAAIQIDLLICG